MTSDINAVGQSFVQHYYTLFDTDRLKLAGLYRAESKMSYEGHYCLGSDQIMDKFMNKLNFQKVAHIVRSVDCQPSGCGGGVIVFVSGDLRVDDEANLVKFSQAFHLLSDQQSPGNFWLHNDIFRLNWG